MPDDLKANTVVDQTGGADKSGGGQAKTGGVTDPAIDESGKVKTQQEDNLGGEMLDNENLPPELEVTRKQLLQDYHSKTQAIAEERRLMQENLVEVKKDRETLAWLYRQEWFKQAAATEKANRGQTKPVELTDEEFDSARTDKRAFQEMIRREAKRLLEAEVQGPMSQLAQETEKLKLDRETERLSKDYPDFDELNDAGKLDEFIDRGYDMESAYAMSKLRQADGNGQTIQKEAEKLLAAKKAAAVEKGGRAKVGGQQILKAKNFQDAFPRVWDALAKGQKDIRVEKE